MRTSLSPGIGHGQQVDVDADDLVTVEPVGDGTHRIEIACRAAVGLDCDVARYLIDAGLSTRKAEMSVDGRFVFMVFVVRGSAAAPGDLGCQARSTAASSNSAAGAPDWAVIARGLTRLAEAGCRLGDLLNVESAAATEVHRLDIACAAGRRADTLAALLHHLYDAELNVTSASTCSAYTPGSASGAPRQASRGPTGAVCTCNFTVCDRTGELPGQARRTELARGIRAAFGASATVEFPRLDEIEAVGSPERPSRGPALCKHAPPGQRLHFARCTEGHLVRLPEGVLQFVGSLPAHEDISICVDETFEVGLPCITIKCQDRQALLLDVLRTAHSLGVRVCHASLDVDPETARVDMQLFLRNAIGTRPLAGDAMLRPLLYQLRKAIAVPAAVLVTPSGEGHADSLAVHVLALPDTAGRGRPRVSLAIAEAVEKMGMCVDSSFVGMLNAQTALQQVTSPQRHTVAAALSLNVLQECGSALVSLGMNSTDLRLASPVAGSAHGAKPTSFVDGEPLTEAPAGRTAKPAADVTSLSLMSVPHNFDSDDSVAADALTQRSAVSSLREVPLRAGVRAEMPTAFLSDNDSDDDDVWQPARCSGPRKPVTPRSAQPLAAGVPDLLEAAHSRSKSGGRPDLLDAPTAYLPRDRTDVGRQVEMHHFQVRTRDARALPDAARCAAQLRQGVLDALTAVGCGAHGFAL